MAAVVVVGTLLVGVSVAVAVSSRATNVKEPPSAITRTAQGHGGATGPAAGHTPTPATTPAPAPTTPGVAVAGAAPVLSSITPATGGPGQTVVISGSGLMSADGQIVATFGGQVAPTSCPSPNTCLATVPDIAGAPPTVPVKLSTAGGTSNAMSFAYG